MFPRSVKRKTTEASEESMAVRLQLELGRDTIGQSSHGAKGKHIDSFRTIPFDKWLRLFMQYAFILAKRDEFDYAVEILRHASWSNAFQARESQDSIRFAIITCAIHGNRYPVAVEQSRKLINIHQFNNEAFRILLASVGHGMHATDAFLASTLSKHLLRELKTADAAFRNKDSLKWNNVTKRYAPTGSSSKADDEDDDEVAIGVLRKAGKSALFYLLHAYEYCPQDPMICLCLAIASVGRAMQRQADNRHHLVTQGLAFLAKYRKIRGEDMEHLDEVEYNFGRAFHQLGLLTHAARHYEQALEIAEKRMREDDQDYGMAQTAAYNLSLIYATTGSTPKAQSLYRRWLSL
ncbi:hypothetical protein EUX98_g9314 [Antrodiella citrinella]|uniref:Uncharacterized protein n=1 Tax=Antrodiella citrinella TaxID=2447956 RepID=A0A4S4LUZ6_9APHY|nr:hypothetical protein EUX98_g9314 [Antrodiella citrinella]